MKVQGKCNFPVGKLPLKVLAQLLDRSVIKDKRVIVGPAIGEDAAVIDIGGPRYLIAKTDPVTFTSHRIGWYAVHINANDIATMGGRPEWFLATLLLPYGIVESDVEKIFQEILEACQSLGVSLIGGHTEITYDLHRPMIVGQMLGEVERERLVRTGGAREGNAIILTKGIAVEGTAIIAREKGEELSGIVGEALLTRAKNFLYEPGISVVKDASVAVASAQVHSMHDPTEGGVATGLHEIAHAAKVGIAINLEALPIFPETRKLCDHYRLDPLGLIASGALLITVEASEADTVVKKLQGEGIPAFVIGQVVHRREGIKLRKASSLYDLPIFEQDEITKILQ
jgi:hydrogenase maturation factor